jgi:serine/threonine protein kinase
MSSGRPPAESPSQPSVKSLCNALAHSGLLSKDDVRALYKRWQTDQKDSEDDLQRFAGWLEENHYATPFQIGLLKRGQGEQLFLNQYVIVDRIGRGRMAGVYKAVHRLGQTVAIKVLPPSKVKDREVFIRFRREARLAVKLKHPNVVRTFQTGQARGLYYLVMEFLEGETLTEVLERRGQLPPEEAARLIHQALQGLQHIHEQSMVHRDLSPGNLMLVGSQPGSTLQATVKVLDIGMGRALFDEEGGSTFELTAAGDVLGNPDYMAPEAARDAHNVDIRADIYSLGCVLYHALAGQPPFADNNRVRQLMRHAQETPRPVNQFNPAVPDGLQQILNWMLAKDPAQRYPTPARGGQALQVFLSAGASVRRLEEEPGMTEFLQWLEVEGDGEEIDVELVPEAVPVALPVASKPTLPQSAPPPAPSNRVRGERGASGAARGSGQQSTAKRSRMRRRGVEEEEEARGPDTNWTLILFVGICTMVVLLGLISVVLVLILRR